MPPRRLPLLLCAALALSALGCASGPAEAPPRPLILVALPAPTLGAESAGPLSPGDFLLEVATQLSVEPRLDLCLVPGPLLAPGLDEDAREEAFYALGTGLGQIAAPIYTGLGAEEREAPDLLEELRRSLRQHPGQAGVWGKPILGWRPVALPAGGEVASLEADARAAAQRARDAKPEEDEDEAAAEDEGQGATPLLVVSGDPQPLSGEGRLALQVVAGPEPALTRGERGLLLTLPPAARGLYAFCTLGPKSLALEWRSVLPEESPPPPPLELPWP